MRLLLGTVFLAISLGATGVPPPQPAENKASVAARLHLVAVCPQITSQCGVPTSAVAQIPDLVAALNCMLKVNISGVPAGDCHDALALLLSQHSAQVQTDNSSSGSSDSSDSSSGETVPVTIEISQFPSLPFPFTLPAGENPESMLLNILQKKLDALVGSSEEGSADSSEASADSDDDGAAWRRPHMPPFPMMGRPPMGGPPPMPFGGPRPPFGGPRPSMMPFGGPHFGDSDDDESSSHHSPMMSKHHSKRHSKHHSKHGSKHGMPPMPPAPWMQHGGMQRPPMPFHSSMGMPPMPFHHSSMMSKHHSKHGSKHGMPPMPFHSSGGMPPMPFHHSSHSMPPMPFHHSSMGMPPMPFQSSHGSPMGMPPMHHSSSRHSSRHGSRHGSLPWHRSSRHSTQFGMWMQSDSKHSRPSFPFPPSGPHHMPPMGGFSYGGFPQMSMSSKISRQFPSFSQFGMSSEHHFPPFGMPHFPQYGGMPHFPQYGGMSHFPQYGGMSSRFSHFGGSKHSKHSKHSFGMSKRGMPFPPFGMSSHSSMPPFMMGGSKPFPPFGMSSHDSMPPFMMGGFSHSMMPMGRPPMSSHDSMPPFMMGGFSHSQGPQFGMGRPPMMPTGRPPMMGRPPMGLPLPPSDSSYDYDASSEEGTPSLLSTIIKEMMGGKPDVEITPVSVSSEGSSDEDNYVADSVEISAPSVEVEPTRTPEIASFHRGDGKEQRIPEEVSYRRAP